MSPGQESAGVGGGDVVEETRGFVGTRRGAGPEVAHERDGRRGLAVEKTIGERANILTKS